MDMNGSDSDSDGADYLDADPVANHTVAEDSETEEEDGGATQAKTAQVEQEAAEVEAPSGAPSAPPEPDDVDDDATDPDPDDRGAVDDADDPDGGGDEDAPKAIEEPPEHASGDVASDGDDESINFGDDEEEVLVEDGDATEDEDEAGGTQASGATTAAAATAANDDDGAGGDDDAVDEDDAVWTEFLVLMQSWVSDEIHHAMNKWTSPEWLDTDLQRVYAMRRRAAHDEGTQPFTGPPASLDELPRLREADMRRLQPDDYESGAFVTKYLETAGDCTCPPLRARPASNFPARCQRPHAMRTRASVT